MSLILGALPGRASDSQASFVRQKALARGRGASLFGVFSRRLSAEEREALTFLYAGMPLCDLANQDGPYFLETVRASLAARRAVPWGRTVPEDVFRAYVLPPRVNNENLDPFRIRTYRELLHRIKGLTMEQAALEINHWCHERVSYQASDARTSAPLATLRTAWGRCGEESVLTVSALRAACIPARQVYTPRWAHCDDNHAWVEAWVDGGWHFLGACEPEPALDRGWFKEPSRRTMLVHTKAYGPYSGPEPVLGGQGRFAELNLTSRYAPVASLVAGVRDREGRPVQGAEVAFGLYNYAEFYPLVTLPTGADGTAKAELGRGDLLLWARKDGRFGFRKATVGQDGIAWIVLDGDSAGERGLSLDLRPPVEPEPGAERVPPEVLDAHKRRVKAEDKEREARIATFMAREECDALSRDLGLDGARVWNLLSRSAGNARGLAGFLRGAPVSRRSLALDLLGSISDKDLRDTPRSVLDDHLTHCASASPEILCPRVDDELLTPWRGFLQRRFSGTLAARARRDPRVLEAWIRANIRRDDTRFYTQTALSPRGVLELRVADSRSLDIFFVCLCRSLGIPARLEPALRFPQFRDASGQWIRAGLVAPEPAPPMGSLHLREEGKGLLHGTHFSLARLEDGRFRTLTFPDDLPLARFPARLDLPAGGYLLITGNRMKGGTVLARLTFFELAEGQDRVIPVALRQPEPEAGSLGRLDPEARLVLGGREVRAGDLLAARGAVLAWVAPGEEPTRHLMSDLKRLAQSYGAWGGPVVLILPPGLDPAHLGPDFQGLPAGVALGEDPSGKLGAAVPGGVVPGAALPALFGVARDGSVVYRSRGYSIGAGDQVLKALSGQAGLP